MGRSISKIKLWHGIVAAIALLVILGLVAAGPQSPRGKSSVSIESSEQRGGTGRELVRQPGAAGHAVAAVRAISKRSRSPEQALNSSWLM